jgi:exodeoxyribonuclease VII small subunit
MSKTNRQDVEKLTFEQSIVQLKAIVEMIGAGQIPLQDSIEQYEKGMALIKHCRRILQQAEKRIEKISLDQEQTNPPEAEEDEG